MFLDHGICTMSPTLLPDTVHLSQDGPSHFNCKLGLDKAWISAFSPELPQPLTSVFVLFFYACICVCNLFDYARVIPTGNIAVFTAQFKGRHLEVMGEGYERGPPASWAMHT